MRDWNYRIILCSKYLDRTFVHRESRDVVPVIFQDQADENRREVISGNQRQLFKRNDENNLVRWAIKMCK